MTENPSEKRCRTSVDVASSGQELLREAVDHKHLGLDALQAIRVQLLKLFARIERLQHCIDEAFAGQPFLPDIAPDAPANRRRFDIYFNEQRRVTNLLARAIELWMLTCGMKREDDWVPLLIEDMRLKAMSAVGASVSPRNTVDGSGCNAGCRLAPDQVAEGVSTAPGGRSDCGGIGTGGNFAKRTH